jgi:hypothetical protein
MKLAALLTFCLVLLLTSAVYAQDVPWPPDSAALFAPGVEVVEAEVFEQSANAPAAGDLNFTIDNDARTIRWYHRELDQWNVYPYPDEVDSFRPLPWDEYQDRLLLYQKTMPYFNALVPDPAGALWFNTQTGEFNTPEVRCGLANVGRFRDQLVFYPDEQLGRTALCDMQTGDMLYLLPRNFNPIDEIYTVLPVQPVPLTGDEWVVVIGTDGLTPLGNYTAYSIERQTGQIRRLGDFQRQGSAWVSGWATDRLIMISTRDSSEWSGCSIYLADVTQVDSVEYATSSIRYCPEYKHDPPRLESSFDPLNADMPSIQCWRIIYNIESRQMHSLDYGDMCWPEIGSVDGDGYYRDPVGEEKYPVDVVRFNVHTQERVELYRGEVEQIVWISDDEREAVLAMDNNGRIDLMPGADTQWVHMEGGTLALVDLTNDTIVYETSAGWDSYSWLTWFPTSSITRLDDSTLLVLEAQPISRPYAYTYQLKRVTLEGNEPHETVLAERVFEVLPGDGERYLVWLDDGLIERATEVWNSSSYLMMPFGLYDVNTDRTYPVLQAWNSDQYSLHVSQIDSQTLTIVVHPISSSGVDNTRQATYTLRIPE